MELLGRGTAWLDMGPMNLHQASVYVKSLQEIQGFQIANLEEMLCARVDFSQALEASLSMRGTLPTTAIYRF